jgi:hypothetical protein
MRNATLEIRSMHCDGCAARIDQAIADIEQGWNDITEKMLLEREHSCVKLRCDSPRGRRGCATNSMRSPSRGGSN